MEIVIALFLLVGGSIALSAWLQSKSSGNTQPDTEHTDINDNSSDRTCLACGHVGEMKTWISNYTVPKFIVIAGFLLGYIPGLIFLAVYWGKYKCSNCGSIGKNQKPRDDCSGR